MSPSIGEHTPLMLLDVAGAPSTSELLELALAVITLLAESLPVRSERFSVAPPWHEPIVTSVTSYIFGSFGHEPTSDPA